MQKNNKCNSYNYKPKISLNEAKKINQELEALKAVVEIK